MSHMKKIESYKVFKQAYLEANLINKLVHKFKNSGYVFATPGDISSLNICINSKCKCIKYPQVWQAIIICKPNCKNK